MRPIIIILFICIVFTNNVQAKRKITFFAEDGLEITADLYFISKDYPFVLLFHQDGYSRGEYNEIAEKILNLNYNCLSVDLRSGGEVNYVKNETAILAEQKRFSNEFIEAEKDINAAIDFAYKRSDTSVILFGSSYSASLCLKASVNNPKVHAVVAFGPGEYFKSDFSLKEDLKELNKPAFIATNEIEHAFVKEILQYAPKENLSIFKPADGNGLHGAKALWEKSINSKEYWLALLMFFSKL